MKIIETLKKWNGIDLTKIVYPIIIILTGWYIVTNIYNIFTEWNLGMLGYIIAFTLVPIGFIYLAFKKIKLRFRWSILSVIGIILIVVFLYDAILLFLGPDLKLSEIFLTGQWDHTFFPIAFGLFFLCDLRKMPRKFWFFPLLFAIICLTPNLNVISNIFYDSWIIPEGPPGFFIFFGVESMAEVSALPQGEFVHGLTEYLQEQLTFFSLFPIVIFYYLIKSFLYD